MISVELDSNFNSEQINNIHEHEAADNCFLVFIGGKYIQVLDQVIEKVKTISKKIGLHPLGLLISLKNNDNPSQLTNYADGADFPLVIYKVFLGGFQLIALNRAFLNIIEGHIFFSKNSPSNKKFKTEDCPVKFNWLNTVISDIQLLQSLPGYQGDSRCCFPPSVSWPLQHSSCETDHVNQWNSQ